MGYTHNMKMTPVGLIPEDWDVATIKEYGHLLSDGINPQQYRDMDFVEYSMPAYDEGQSPTKCKGADMNSNRTQIKGEVLLFNKLNVRQKRVWYIEKAPSKALCSMEFLAYSSDKVDLRLLREILLQDSVTKGFESVSRGTSNSQKRIAPSDFLNFSFALPPLAEQHRIADALSGVDKMIGALDEAIAKKRQIKEGLMQQLLTGKTRLPGFNGAWAERRLDSFEIVNGSMLKSSEYETGNVPVIAGGQTPAGFHSKANRPANTITISGSGAYAGFVSFHTIPIFASDCSTICNPKNVDIIYLYFCLLSKQKEIYKCQAGGAQPHVHAKDIKDITIMMPSSVEEQKAISSVLTKSDDEIKGLEAQRDKYTLIKQGMMQELLTGKTRLI